MQEESKEEFLARHRKSLGIIEESEEPVAEEPSSILTRLRNWLYLILLLVFVWLVYQMFGMMKSN